MCWRGKKKQFYRNFIPFVLVKSCLNYCYLVAMWAELSVAQEVRKISDDFTKKEFLKIVKYFAEDPIWSLKKIKWLFSLFMFMVFCSFLDWICDFMLHEHQPTVAEGSSNRTSWSATSVLVVFAFVWFH